MSLLRLVQHVEDAEQLGEALVAAWTDYRAAGGAAPTMAEWVQLSPAERHAAALGGERWESIRAVLLAAALRDPGLVAGRLGTPEERAQVAAERAAAKAAQ